MGLFSWVSASSNLIVGDDVYIGKFCSIQCNGAIGDGVLIANNVGIVGRRDHHFRQIGTLISKAKWVGENRELSECKQNRIEIKADVWIGFGSTILSGITIGRGAVISAGSVVRDDVAPYDIVSGNPAVPIGRRFTDGQIAEHELLLGCNGQSPQSSVV